MKIFESFLDGLHTVCAGFSDSPRRADVDYTMADIGLSASSWFFMQSQSSLSQQRHLEHGHGTSNCHTLFGMKKIPTDNSIRLRSRRKMAPRSRTASGMQLSCAWRAGCRLAPRRAHHSFGISTPSPPTSSSLHGQASSIYSPQAKLRPFRTADEPLGLRSTTVTLTRNHQAFAHRWATTPIRHPQPESVR